ncbi:MAG: thioredoxin family protein [Chloroflexi bacterium]|nr:thioredoxin family protein [Chloroflexota bacterium]
MITVKILGPGCSNCKMLEIVTRKAVTSLGIEAEIIKVEDYGEIMEYPILSTPALVINEKVLVSGRVPSIDQICTWLADALEV